MSETGTSPPVHSIHHHPAVKWVLMVAMLAVAGLGLPRSVFAAAPSVQAPTGPQSGGVFTGTFTFGYYINCTNGASYSSSYSSSLDGTNTFDFYGANDGSLLLSVDSGGLQLISSCGDPYTGQSLAASYTVSKNTAPPPTPTPTPTSTPNPTPTPTPSGGGGGGGSGGGTTGGGGTTATPTPKPGATPTPIPAGGSQSTPTPMPSFAPSGGATPTPAAATGHKTTGSGGPKATAASHGHLMLMLSSIIAFIIIIVAGGLLWASRQPALRRRLDAAKLTFAWRVEPYWFRLKRWVRFRHGATEARRRGLSRHRFSGRLLAHHHTSYPTLAFLLIITTVMVAGVGLTSHAADSTLSLSVAGAPPTQGADITDPLDGATLTTAIITVRGTCADGLRVEITRNGDFAGSTLCDNSGLYSLVISLVDDTNILQAANYDGADQPGPATAPVTVTYLAPSTPTPTPTPAATPTPTPSAGGHATPNPTPTPHKTTTTTPPAAALIINSERHYYAGLTTGSPLNWDLSVSGGSTPYALSVDWGDRTSTKQNLATAGGFSATHIYTTAGTYHIVFNITDGAKRVAVLSVVAIVSGPDGAAVTATSPPKPDGNLAMAWPILIGSTLVVLSFWLGERDRLTRMRPIPVHI